MKEHFVIHVSSNLYVMNLDEDNKVGYVTSHRDKAKVFPKEEFEMWSELVNDPMIYCPGYYLEWID